MKLKALKGFCLGAGRDVYPGDVFDATDKDAAIYIKNGSAVKAEDIKATSAKKKAESDHKGGV